MRCVFDDFQDEKGAFTGATAQRLGRFEQVRGGTLFLDEIGDMPMELQTRLLRVLSNGFFYRVGGHQPIKADVRIIATTNQNLEQRVKDGLFREDLYHRLNVIRLRLPPLCERPEDIAPLAEHFLRTEARALGVEAKRLTPEALARLEAFRFPGNVRQLENLCRWLLVMAPAVEVRVEDLPRKSGRRPRMHLQGRPALLRKEPLATGRLFWRSSCRRSLRQERAAYGSNSFPTSRERSFERRSTC